MCVCVCGDYLVQWAEVLSADAFSAFEEVGLENEEVGEHATVVDDVAWSTGVVGWRPVVVTNMETHVCVQAVKETGKRFRDTVLGLGGGRPPLDVRMRNAWLFVCCLVQ